MDHVCHLLLVTLKLGYVIFSVPGGDVVPICHSFKHVCSMYTYLYTYVSMYSVAES